MTNDRPLEVTEMAVRVVIQIVWFGALAAALTWWSWESLRWAHDGFPAPGQPDPMIMLLHGAAAFLACAFAIRAAGMSFFQLVPFMIAKRLQPKPPGLKRGR